MAGGGAGDLGLAFLRLAGLGLAYHGYPKVFGGQMSDTVGAVKAINFPLPTVFAWAAGISELGGGILVAVGFFARAGAAFAAITMFVAAFLVQATASFERRELALVYLVVMLALACQGAGKWSVDGLVRKSS